nr:hypothetical protein [Chitinophagaceae bacterium]
MFNFIGATLEIKRLFALTGQTNTITGYKSSEVQGYHHRNMVGLPVD